MEMYIALFAVLLSICVAYYSGATKSETLLAGFVAILWMAVGFVIIF